MVDIKDTSILSTGFSEKNESVSDVSDNNYIDDDPMDNLAYSDSESTSIAMPDDDFCDALDQLAGDDVNSTSKEGVKDVVSPITMAEQSEVSNGLQDDEPKENVEVASDCLNVDAGNVEEKTEKSYENDVAEKSPAVTDNLNGISELDEVSCEKPVIESAQPEIKSIDTIEVKSLSEEISENADTNNTTEIDSSNLNQLELCNGDLQEAILDNTSNIDVPTPNEDVDGVEGDFDFDQIYDDLQEKNKLTSEIGVENDLDVPELNATFDEAIESKDNTEPISANSIDDLDEELLLKSPSMQEKFDEDTDLPEYSESVLLKDDSKEESINFEKSITILDSTDEPADDPTNEPTNELTDESMETSKTENDSNNCESKATPESRNVSSEIENEQITMTTDVFDQLKTLEPVKETSSNEVAYQVGDAFGNELEKCTKVIGHLDENEHVSVKQTEITETPTLVTEENSDSLENLENKENNLLEAMTGSPISADNGESSSSFRDDYVANENEFCDQVIDLKDDNSTDARDGFNDNKSDEEVDASSINKTDSNDASQSTDNLEILTEQVDSSENKPEDVKDVYEKSNESMVAISLDDDDSIIEESTTDATKTSTEDDQPPAKRARLELIENEESSNKSIEDEKSTNEDKVVDAGIQTEKTETMETTEAAEATEETKESENKVADIEEDDDLVIIESTETREPSPSITSNKRRASPLMIDAEDESHKKLKSDSSEAIPKVCDTKIDESTKTDETAKESIDLKCNEVSEQSTENQQSAETKFELKPKPEECVKRTIALDFAEKFKKGLNQMSRKNLEEFVLEKIIEAIVHKSDYSELKKKSETQEQMIQASRVKLQELNKQYRDLEMVYARLKKDLENKNQNIVTPIKITRAVGLQVCLQKANNKEASASTPALSKTVHKTYAPQVVNRAPAAVATQPKALPIQKPITQVQRQPVRAIAARQVTPDQRVVTTVQRRLIQPNNIQQHIVQVSPQRKIVPVPNRATLIPTQEQNQRAPQMIVKKINPNGRIVVVNQNATTSTHQITAINKISPNIITSTAAAAANQRGGPSGFIQVRQNLMANNSSCIDLTDEEDPKPQARQQANPPALVALNARSRQQIVQTVPVQRQLVATQQTIRNAAVAAQTRKLPIIAPKGGANVPVAQQPTLTVNRVTSTPSPTQNQAQQMQRKAPPTRHRHPAPLPYPYNPPGDANWKRIPPRPIIRINNNSSGIVISWTMEQTKDHAEIVSYQIYAYQETSNPPSTDTWRHVGDVKAMLLPMAVTLTQFQEGQKYHFAVRAVDEHGRSGLFSVPRTY